MSAQDEVAEFAALLRQFKERTDRSYGSLARRLGMNTSTLHRYCAGDAVPQDFAPVERFAALCGATAEERMELHRRWLLAVAARQRPRGAVAGAEETEGAGAEPEAEVAVEPEPEVGDATPEPVSTPPRPRPWYRRRRITVAAAVGSVLLATLGTLTALDTDRGERGGGKGGAAASRTSVPGVTKSPSPTASASPSATNPSPSKSGSGKPSSSTTEPGTGAPPSKGANAGGTPLTWSADSHMWAQGCGHDYVIDRPPAKVAPPPPPQDARTWAGSQGAVHGRNTMVRISVQGKSSTAVVLEALRVRVVGRAAPVEGNSYAMDQGCGGAVTPRFFDVDLDKDRPIARPADGNDSGTTIPAMRLPYRVSAEDPEVLLVTAGTEGCDCRWYLELDWSSQGRTGTIRIDDEGRPFRTTAIEGLPRYMYDTLNRKWGPYS
ncbi:helix-turn-helix domain-containing protein [Streptomyces cinnabarinus]|uniref:Helix-turn-helix domain-containing protein n=1 Tax=Streptomyces cinnabarinus TaxID=67287 RepID=A0ABY7KKA2_9ACTN|nr:helix-turn-helix transcriptional regulator [Streptomyces cinnabarinus]WAZ24960.1 helix-turn-helix domain-containing protein [Streptomyces cinnabarinus]